MSSSSDLVKDPLNFLDALRRMHMCNDAVIFWNEERSFKIMLRSDAMDPDILTFELLIVYDEDTDPSGAFKEILENYHDGYFEEDDCSFVIDNFTLPSSSKSTDQAICSAMRKVNDAYDMTVCPCYKYIIKDGAEACVFCVLTAARQEEEKERVACPICHETGLENQMKVQPCCKQQMHSRCLARWQEKPCPLCRAPP